MSEERKLKKNLGVLPAVSVVVGCVIGAGVFFKPYAIYQATGGAPGMGMLAWVLGGLMSLFGALTFTEAAVMIPETGGMAAYLSKAYGEKIGYLAGWLQTLSTFCKLIPLFLLMIFGFVLGEGGNSFTTPLVGEGISLSSALGTTLLAVLFAFEGWTNVGALAGEMKNPGKDLPKAIVGGVGIIMAVYLLINMAYLNVIPADELMNLESPASAVAERIFGSYGGMLIKIGIIISVIGAANGFLMSGSRVAYLLAEKKQIPFSHKLSRLNSNQVPEGSIILIGVLGALYSLIGQFDFLTDLGVFSCWIFYTLTFGAVIVLRHTCPNAKRDYKVPLYPLIPLLAIFSGAYVIFSQIFLSGSRTFFMAVGSIGVTLLGLPVYYLVRKYDGKNG